MTNVEVHLRVKFRAWGITFGTIDRRANWPVPVAIPHGHAVLIDDHGCFLEVTV